MVRFMVRVRVRIRVEVRVRADFCWRGIKKCFCMKHFMLETILLTWLCHIFCCTNQYFEVKLDFKVKK